MPRLPDYLPASSFVRLPFRLPTYAYLPACLPAYPHLPAYLLTYLPTYLLTVVVVVDDEQPARPGAQIRISAVSPAAYEESISFRRRYARTTGLARLRQRVQTRAIRNA